MPYIYVPSSAYGGNTPAAMPGFTSAGPDPRKHGRPWTNAELRAEELAREKHKDEMRAIYEARRQKEAERKQKEADALAERRAAQRERDQQRYYEAHPEQWEKDQRIAAGRKEQQERTANAVAERKRWEALTPEQQEAEREARRAKFRAEEEKRYADYKAKQQAAANEEKIQQQFRQASGVDNMNPPGAGRFGGKAEGMDITTKLSSGELPYSERMGEDQQAAPSKALAAAKPVQPVASQPKPAPVSTRPAAQTSKIGPATSSAGAAFEEARKANPNLSASEFFASRPDLIASMQAEQNPTAGWSINQPAKSNVWFDKAGKAHEPKFVPQTPIEKFRQEHPAGSMPDPMGETAAHVYTGLDNAFEIAKSLGSAFHERFLADDKKPSVTYAPAQDPEVANLQGAANISKPLGQGGLAFDPTIRPGYKPEGPDWHPTPASGGSIGAAYDPKKVKSFADWLAGLMPESFLDPRSMYHIPGTGGPVYYSGDPKSMSAGR